MQVYKTTKSLKEDKIIIDLGSGLQPVNRSAICVDKDDAIIKELKRRGYNAIRYDLNLLPYPFEDNFADEIYTSHVLEHLQVHVINFFRECFRILKPNGILYFSCPNAYYIKSRIAYLLGRHIPSYHPFHVKQLKPSYVRELLYHLGFDVLFLPSQNNLLLRGLEKVRRNLFAIDIKIQARKRP